MLMYDRYPEYKNTQNYDSSRLLQMTWNVAGVTYDTLDTKTYFIDSGVEISDDTKTDHKITSEIIKTHGVSLESILDELNTALSRATHIIAHNMPFNYNIICGELHRINSPASKRCLETLQSRKTVCTMYIFRRWLAIKKGRHGQIKDPRLEQVYKRFLGRCPDNFHRSDGSVQCLTNILKYARKRYSFAPL